MYFWPNEWETVLGQEKAVGHFVKVFMDTKWVEGQIIAFDATTGTHTLSVLSEVDVSSELLTMEADAPSSPSPAPPVSPSRGGGGKTPSEDAALGHPQAHTGGEEQDPPIIELTLSSAILTWTDTAHRQDMKGLLGRCSGPLLSYSAADKDQFVRVWWPNYGRDYYGRVLSYDPIQGLHTIAYEDKDERAVCMSDMEYSVIENIPESILASTHGRSHGTAAMIVGTWHKQTRELPPVAPSHPDDASGAVCIRPDPRINPAFCYHHADIVDAFVTEGGFTSLFSSLRDVAVPPPDLPTLILHMKLVYYFRSKIYRQQFYANLAWEMKEIVPFTVLRFEEAQIKTVTKNDLVIVLCGLRDIVVMVNSKDSSMDRDIAILNLRIAAKLIRCDQLQKRYLGLSIVKDEVERVMPSVSSVMAANAPHTPGSQNRQPSPPTPPQTRTFDLGLAYVEQWVVESNLLDSIFGESLHQDLVTKSEFLLVFLSLSDRLTEEQVSAVWQSSLGGHEAVVRTVYQLIIRILPVLKPGMRAFLFNLISTVPYADYTDQYLHLLKDYTIVALRIEDGSTAGAGIGDGPSFLHGGEAAGTAGSDDSGGVQGRRGQVVSAPERRWLGFGVLWQFLQDQVHTSSSGGGGVLHASEALLDLAIQLLVDLLKDDFKEVRELVFRSCMQNIKRGTSVAVSVKITRLALSLYPSTNAGWFGVGRTMTSKATTVGVLIERLNKHDNILEAMFTELETYSTLFREQSRNFQPQGSSGQTMGGKLTTPPSSTSDMLASYLNDFRVKVKGSVTRIPHLRGLSERLLLLGFLLTNSTLRLNDSQLMMLWKVYVEEAGSPQVTDMFISWLGRLLVAENRTFHMFLNGLSQEGGYCDMDKPDLLLLRPGDSATDAQDESDSTSCFGDSVLRNLLRNKLCMLAKGRSRAFEVLCREAMALFCLKLILFVNIAAKVIKVESDGLWCRTGGALEGDTLLWRLCVEVENPAVQKVTCFLLIELHHRLSAKLKDAADEIRSNFLKQCFTKISKSIVYIQPSDHVDAKDNSIEDPTVPVTGDDDSALDAAILARQVKRFVTLMRLFVQRFSQKPRQFCRIVVISSRSSSRLVEMTLSLDDTIGSLRERIGAQFHVQLENVGLGRIVTKSKVVPRGADPTLTSEKLDKDDATLRSLRFRPVESILVKRIEGDMNSSERSKMAAPGKVLAHDHAAGKAKKADVILSKHLLADFLPPLNPLEWLGIDTQKVQEEGGDMQAPLSIPLPSGHTEDMSLHPIFSMPLLPLTRPDVVLTPQPSAASSRHRGSSGGAARLAEYLGPYLDRRPEHFDQLLQMLDGYLSLETEVGSLYNGHGCACVTMRTCPAAEQ